MSRPAKRTEQAALFGSDLPEAPPAPRVNDRPEAAALGAALQVLKHHHGPPIARCSAALRSTRVRGF